VQSGGTQSFTATVTNTSNAAVTWQVNGVAGGNSTMGMISASGVYSAPSMVPSPATLTVTAVSVADPTRSGSAQVTITPPSSAPTPAGPNPGGSGGCGGGWARRAFSNLFHWTELDRGGHFAAYEQPRLFVDEMRACFGTIR
jgi:hypothetical protein